MPSPAGGFGGVSRGLGYRAWFLLACAVGGLAFVGFAALALLYYAFSRNGEKAAMLWIRSFGFVMTRFLFWRVVVENISILHATQPAVVVGNHQSNLDIATWATFFPYRSVAVGKKEILKIPVFGWLWKATNNILIDRSNAIAARESLAAAAERIRTEKLSVWVLPEGHRNAKPEMLPFKKGAFHLAIAAQVPVVPFATSPMWTVLDAKRWIVRPGVVRVRFLPPIPTEGMTSDDADRLSLAAREAIEEARQDFLKTAGPRIG
ncbi:MAG: lysophospholipid acyltransferase family protein [Thermoanaerobaculia bacterium]